MKTCIKCKQEKELDEFFAYGRNKKDSKMAKCKCCFNLYSINRKDDIKQYKAKYQIENSDKLKIIKNIYFENNKETILSKNKKNYELKKESYLATNKKYREKNIDKINAKRLEYRQKNVKEISRRSTERIKSNPFLSFKNCLRLLTLKAFKDKKYSKNTKTHIILGVDFEIVKLHIERQFKKGMNWDNRGMKGWHIDHIIPLDSAKTKEDLIMLCHYTNLQPLWWYENLAKRNKIPQVQMKIAI